MKNKLATQLISKKYTNLSNPMIVGGAARESLSMQALLEILTDQQKVIYKLNDSRVLTEHTGYTKTEKEAGREKKAADAHLLIPS